MCWYVDDQVERCCVLISEQRYNDAIYDDWVVDFHPEFKNVVIAAGDSGHAFKVG